MAYIFGILAWLLFPTSSDIEALRKSAPYYLTYETAEIHLRSARVAAFRHNLEADLLLSIAHHESRYSTNTVTSEPRGKESCGVMTPVPLPRGSCDSEVTAAEGYEVGAAHLRGWMDVCRDRARCALLGYAGGYALIRACSRGKVLRHQDHGDDLCDVPDAFFARARYIQRLRANSTRF
jgi:hypothetical protein